MQALDTGRASVTGAIKPLAAAHGDELTVAVVQAIYHSGQGAETVPARRAAIKGFVVGIFRVGRLVESSLAGLGPRGLDVYLYDAAAKPRTELLYFSAAPSRAEATRPLTEEDLLSGTHIVRALDLAGTPGEWSSGLLRDILAATAGYR